MNIIKRPLLCLALLLSLALPSYSQGDIDQLLKESVDDGEKLIQGYINPFMKSVSVGLSQGWYNTAKPHKLFGVDLTITVSAMTIPKKDLFYDISTLGLNNIAIDRGTESFPKAPTMFGPDQSVTYNFYEDGVPEGYYEGSGAMPAPTESFEGQSGMDLKGELGRNWMPLPMVHFGIGLPKNTDLKVRLLPTIDFDGGKVKMFGLGVMHDVKQHIPGIKLAPFDLSAFVGYTKLSLSYTYEDENNVVDDQRGEFSVNTTTIQGVISKKISVLTVYGGLGYNIAKSNIAVKGTWDVNDDGVIEPEEKNPVDLNFTASGPRVTGGFRLKLAVFTLHADYTLQKYRTLTAGFGINVR